MNQKKILFVFAHPDDETFTSGITIAKYAREEAAEIALLCATRGGAGKAGDPPICSPAELPLYRERELRKAAEILGIQHVALLEYEDKHLSDLPSEILAGHVADAIKHYQPQVVITFASHGISGHPDHQAISKAATMAVKQLPLDENPVKKLYHATYPSTSSPGMTKPLHTDPYETITTEITAPAYKKLVAEALAAHRTQHLSVERVFPGVLQGDDSRVRTTNFFILVWSNLPNYRITGKETDLFAGIPF
jgi:LmbE family N-acetylglucosaminyl deacetylase